MIPADVPFTVTILRGPVWRSGPGSEASPMHEPGPKKQQYFTAMMGTRAPRSPQRASRQRRAGQAANTIELLEALMREAMSAGTLCLDLCRALNLLAANTIKLVEALLRESMSASTLCLDLCQALDLPSASTIELMEVLM